MAILDPPVRRSAAFYTRYAAAALVALIAVPAAAVQVVSERPVTNFSDRESARPASTVVSQNRQPAILVQSPTVAQSRRAAAQAAAPATVVTGASQDEIVRRSLNRALVEFAGDGVLDGVAAMLTAGADVNAEIIGDGSALIAAAGDGHLRVVRYLLDNGADPNLAVRGDGTALIAAAGDGHLAVVDLLLQRGAQVNQIVEGDETALIQAAGDGHLDVVKLLVSHGADVNLGVWVEQTIWRGARRDGPPETRTELRTPLSEARQDGHTEVVNFLIAAGAHD